MPCCYYICSRQSTYSCKCSSNNVNKLGKYLNLSSVQAEEVANICNYFDEQMGRATTAKKNKDTMVRNAVYGNLKLMKKTLTDAQYTKYTTILNMTLKNKGIEVK